MLAHCDCIICSLQVFFRQERGLDNYVCRTQCICATSGGLTSQLLLMYNGKTLVLNVAANAKQLELDS